MSTTRREFLEQIAAAATLAATASLQPASAQSAPASASAQQPWYRRARRWGQTNITEADVQNYDIPWWRQHWKRTRVQGVVLNAGGIVAYYPSKFELHYRPPNLNGRDLYGELAKAAHDDGLAVFARMDSSKAHEPLYRAHPDWFAVDANNQPYRSGEFYLSCINTPYYTEWLPGIIREIIERSHPEGVTDNIWAGLERNQICYCAACKEKFAAFSGGMNLPNGRNWNDPAFRRWIEWSYARRIEQWEFNNKLTRDAGGPDCLWVGMNGADILGQSNSFRDLKEICARAEMIMLDNQSRGAGGLQENALDGKIIHSVLGWDKLIPESMAMYQHGRPQYRLTSKSTPEARMWMLSGFAGGIQPWWHHVAAYHEDRRMYQTAEPVNAWHQANEEFLFNRKPVATVAVAWSHRNTDFFGRENAAELVEQPFRGFTQALIRARIPFVPVHLDYLARDARDLGLKLLILPNIGAITTDQLAAIRAFVQNGGSLIATGQTSLHDQWGDPLDDFALSNLFGVTGGAALANASAPRGRGGGGGAGGANAIADQHTYLRLTPELRARVYGPKHGDEPAITGERHPILAGFDQTDILEFGGTLPPALRVAAGAQVLATYIPPFPSTPPEIVYMRTPRTDIPALVINQVGSSRIVYLPADLDRRFATVNFPDHGDLLANAVRWASGGAIPLTVEGPGLINCELYRQNSRLILHLLNVTSAGTWRAPVHELIPVGPVQVRVQLDKSAAPRCRSLISPAPIAARLDNGWASFEIKSILDHEVIVIET